MKRFFLLLSLLLLCTGFAAAESVTDRIWPVATQAQSGADQLYLLLDDNPDTCWRYTAWTSTATDDIPELAFQFSGETLSAVWIRTGDCAGIDAYLNQAVPTTVRLRVYAGYGAADYSYALPDVFDLSTFSGSRAAGYECLALPAPLAGVTRVELFITAWRRGSTYPNSVCVSDIVFSGGTGATAPLPGGTVSGGVRTTLSMRLATRSGPSTRYTELGSYFKAGDPITVLSRAYDEVNEIWWVQVEFTYRGAQRRAYTGLKRVNLDADLIPEERLLGEATVLRSATAYYGPGTGYTRYSTPVPAGTQATVYGLENGFAQLEYATGETGKVRVWVSLSDVSFGAGGGDIIY